MGMCVNYQLEVYIFRLRLYSKPVFPEHSSKCSRRRSSTPQQYRGLRSTHPPVTEQSREAARTVQQTLRYCSFLRSPPRQPSPTGNHTALIHEA